MQNHFNDNPIETVEEDKYGINPFAHSIANSILNIKSPIGTAIAITGPWGSGKSGAINLIRNELNNLKNADLIITDFNCWWHRGEEALTLAFFQHLNSILQNTLGDKVKNIIPKIGRSILQAGPIIGPAVALATTGPFGAIAAGSANFAKRFFPAGDTVEQTFNKLSNILQNDKRRFLVIIDDIDRLNPDEVLAIFRLIKSVGKLPNIMYLLAFDRTVAEKALLERFPSEGTNYLEKIIQASFELPKPLQTDINQSILKAIELICGSPQETQIQNIMNNFYDAVVPYIKTPRDVVRFQNTISITWPAIKNEISIADFIALETIRLYEPSLFDSIGENKERVCGTGHDDDVNYNDGDQFLPFLNGVPGKNKETAKLVLKRLFPKLENLIYDGDFRSTWDIERRVCIEKHFETYFRFSISEETLSSETIKKLVERSADSQFIQSTFLNAKSVSRKNGNSMVPVYLEELTVHSSKIRKESVKILLTTLFNIHDEIDLECDEERGFSGIADTSLQFHWLIRRITEDRFTLEERTQLYVDAIQTASLGWLVDFVSSARNDYFEKRDGPQPEASCLVLESAIPKLIEKALSTIRTSAKNGVLLKHKDLIYILYRWKEFENGDASKILVWTNNLLNNTEALVILADQFTGESWSHSLGFADLGDRVSTRTIRVQIDKTIDIIDPIKFRSALEQLAKTKDLDEKSEKIVNQFLTAWVQK